MQKYVKYTSLYLYKSQKTELALLQFKDYNHNNLIFTKQQHMLRFFWPLWRTKTKSVSHIKKGKKQENSHANKLYIIHTSKY